jgi:carotenoid cleavage dioxygenase
MDLPAVFDLDMALRGEMPIRWDDNYPARLGVMPRNGTDADVTWYDVEPGYVFHPMNAYEDGDNFVLDVARFDHIWRDGAMDFPSPMLHRWTIDTSSRKVTQEQVDDRPAEFPRVADSVIGLPHRFGYMMAASFDSMESADSAPGALLKYDRVAGTTTSIELGAGRMPGEPVFVPAATGSAEDDGYLMTYVYDAASHASEFVIFDAATMSAEPVASVALPRVPSGFHGSWVPASVVA